MKRCPVCDALERFTSIDDDEANAIVLASDMSTWCVSHVRAWLATRKSTTRGRERLRELFKCADA